MISARPGNRLDGGSEDGWKAKERALDIEFRRLGAQQNNLRLTGANGGQRGHKPLDRRLHLQNHLSAASGNQIA